MRRSSLERIALCDDTIVQLVNGLLVVMTGPERSRLIPPGRQRGRAVASAEFLTRVP